MQNNRNKDQSAILYTIHPFLFYWLVAFISIIGIVWIAGGVVAFLQGLLFQSVLSYATAVIAIIVIVASRF